MPRFIIPVPPIRLFASGCLLLVSSVVSATPVMDRRAERLGLESFVLQTIMGAEHTVSLRALNGVMLLTGSVPDLETLALAGEMAAQIPGIDRVENQLQVAGAPLDADNLLARRIQLHLWTLAQINPGTLRITVAGGVTTIAGLCRNSAQRQLVEAGVRLYSGQEVINETVVSAGRSFPELPRVIDDVSVTTFAYRALRRIGLGIGQGTVIRTRDGMVMINGLVASEDIREQATGLVREVRGVQSVINNLRVRP